MTWPHLHLMLNHVPVLGAVFGFLLLAYGVWLRNDTLQRAALWSFAIVALAAVPVYLTGEPAEEAVEHLAGTGTQMIEAHQEAALVSLIAIELLGVVALATLWLARGPWMRRAMNATLAIAFATVGLMAWTANLGGQIRRPELRQAATGQQQGEADEGDHEDGRP